MLPTRRSTWMNRAELRLLSRPILFLLDSGDKKWLFSFSSSLAIVLEIKSHLQSLRHAWGLQSVKWKTFRSKRGKITFWSANERKHTFRSVCLTHLVLGRSFFGLWYVQLTRLWAKRNIQRMYMIQRFESIYFRLCFASSQVFLLNDLTIKLERKDSQHANEVSLSRQNLTRNAKQWEWISRFLGKRSTSTIWYCEDVRGSIQSIVSGDGAAFEK